MRVYIQKQNDEIKKAATASIYKHEKDSNAEYKKNTTGKGFFRRDHIGSSRMNN